MKKIILGMLATSSLALANQEEINNCYQNAKKVSSVEAALFCTSPNPQAAIACHRNNPATMDDLASAILCLSPNPQQATACYYSDLLKKVDPVPAAMICTSADPERAVSCYRALPTLTDNLAAAILCTHDPSVPVTAAKVAADEAAMISMMVTMQMMQSSSSSSGK